MVLAMTSLVGNTQTASGLGVLGAVSCAVRPVKIREVANPRMISLCLISHNLIAEVALPLMLLAVLLIYLECFHFFGSCTTDAVRNVFSYLNYGTCVDV